MTPLSSNFLEYLRIELGEEAVLTEPADIAPYLGEARGLMRGEAGAVIRPRSTEEVATLMRLAYAAEVPVSVQGGNTGLVGGGLPFGGLVLSLARLDRIRSIDPVNAALVAEAGVVLARVQQAAAEVARLFPLSLASEGSCTIGGNIASNAGGTAVLRYGNMRDLVLGLEVVLADGRVLNGLSALRKDNAGYDLKQLFIGSEGTLGVITAAALKLFPLPRSRLAAFAAAQTPAAIVTLFDRLRARAGERLTTYEILPRFGIEIVTRHVPGTRDPLGAPHPWYAFLELTAPEPDAPLETLVEGVLEEALGEGLVSDATIAASGPQAAALWRIREELSDAQRHEGGSIKHDVSVPISRVADFIDETIRLCAAALPGIRPCVFGHIGDGNIHFNLSQPVGMAREAFLRQWHRYNLIVHDEVAKRGGSIAAEHGVGLFKRDELERYKERTALDLMVSLKQALDPKNLLNRGKVVSLERDDPAFLPAMQP